MNDEAFLHLPKPVHATPREADLFAIAGHYREIIEDLLTKARRQRVIYSDSLLRDLGLALRQAPRPELLHYQPHPIVDAPRDGRSVVVLCADEERPFVARFNPGNTYRDGWLNADTGLPLDPIAYIPIA